MKYINKLNGAIVETVCEIQGEDWTLLEETKETKTKTNKKGETGE